MTDGERVKFLNKIKDRKVRWSSWYKDTWIILEEIVDSKRFVANDKFGISKLYYVQNGFDFHLGHCWTFIIDDGE